MTSTTKPGTRPPARRASASHAPFAILGVAAIAAGFGGFGLWAATAPLASAAIAPAQVSLDTNRKPIQHLEGGIVAEILVKETERVSEGQVLFRLKPVQASALEARLLAETRGAAAIEFPAPLLARGTMPETAAAMADQSAQFEDRRRSLESQAGVFKARIEQTRKDMEGKQHMASALATQIASYDDEIARVRPVAAKGFYPKNKLLALERERTRLTGEAGATASEMARGNQVIAESEMQIRLAVQRYKEEASQKLTEVRTRLAELGEKLAVAADTLQRIDIRAPRDGIVQGLKVFAEGAVVKPGETIAELIPVSDKLVLTARVSPLDIDGVRPGQEAEVRFPAFSSRVTSTIIGRVEKIAADTMTDEATRESYYPARIVVDLAALPRDIADRLVPGMPADVLVTTGERTVLAYLAGPLSDTLAKTMRED
jgi:HlyD family secretion protein